MTEKQKVQLIEKYLTGSLEANECIKVEWLLLTDQAFETVFSSMRSAFEFINWKGRKSLSEKMQKWEASLPKVSMENQNIRERIENYLVGRLGVDEILEFEKDLENDPKFRQQFEETKLLMDGIQYAGRQKLLKRMQRIEAESEDNKTGTAKMLRMPTKTLVALAAGLALLVALTFIFDPFNSNSSSNTLFTDNFTKYPSDLIQRSADIPAETQARIKEVFPDYPVEKIYEAFLAYESEKYNKAIAAFEDLLAENASPSLLFYKGQSHLAKRHTEKAIADFDAYLQSGEQRYRNQSIYYKGLALIAAGKQEEVKDLWTDFGKRDCHYCTKAKELLDKME